MPRRPRAGHHAAAERVPCGGGQVSGLSQREAGRLLTGAVQHIGFLWLCRNKVPQTRGLETRHFVSQLGRPESEVKVSAGPASQTLWAAPSCPTSSGGSGQSSAMEARSISASGCLWPAPPLTRTPVVPG
uniref:Uncharacterized protein n=1 Tax=Rousettus aegyptiacus TaxID=9407 RepID=A0A7J8FKE6_ROUAE|nr:hypothetical protein HJG63_012026 [Rousettus aegyptiacus]